MPGRGRIVSSVRCGENCLHGCLVQAFDQEALIFTQGEERPFGHLGQTPLGAPREQARAHRKKRLRGGAPDPVVPVAGTEADVKEYM